MRRSWRNNAEAQTWKKQFGSLGYRAGLHGNELWLRSGRRKARDDLGHPGGRGTRRHILRYRRSLRLIRRYSWLASLDLRERTFPASIRALMYSSTGPTRVISRGWLLKTSWTSTKKFLSGETSV